MHQHPRPVPRNTSTAGTAPATTNRTVTPRTEAATSPSRTSLSSESGSTRSSSTDSSQSEETTPQDPERQRLNLIVQHFFSKAALIVLSSRVTLPAAQTKDGDIRLDKWFNTWLRDTNVLSQDLAEWRNMEAGMRAPPNLVVEFYLDLDQQPRSQALVALDDERKRWDVAKSLDSHAKTKGLVKSPSAVVYERWIIGLDSPTPVPASQMHDAPPNIYKKGVVLLRSLFTYTRLLPGWKFSRRISKQAGNSGLPRPRFRIAKGSGHTDVDTLDWALTNQVGSVTEDYHFNKLPCAFGSLRVSVKYRTNCNFELDAAEKLLSAQIATGSGSGDSSNRADSTSEELAHDSRYKPWTRMPSAEAREDQPARSGSDARTGSGSKSSLRSEIISSSVPRRTSVSFQPFKAGSLSSSPAGSLPISASPNAHLGRPVSSVQPSHSRSRSSLNTLPQQALRAPPIANETAIASSTSSSPKPAPIQRYSSSFSNRKARFPSSMGTNKTEEDGSSSRGSVSSTQRPSGPLGGSGVGQDDSEAIGDFLKMLDTSSRRLPNFGRTDPASLAANTQRTVAQYSKFARMRDSTAQLSDSMSSSLMLHRSSTSSSRQLTNVPGLISGAATGGSASSSPGGKPISPHTPHMPSVPSRLSNNSIASYSRPEPSTDRSDHTQGAGPSQDPSDRERAMTPTAQAIDIPSSPRIWPSERRSSSVHNNARAAPRFIGTGAVDDDMMPFGLRSASLPGEERGIASRLHGSGGGSGRGGDSGEVDGHEEEEEEPLLFDLGELGRESIRRS